MWIKYKKILSKIENIEIIGNQLSVNGRYIIFQTAERAKEEFEMITRALRDGNVFYEITNDVEPHEVDHKEMFK